MRIFVTIAAAVALLFVAVHIVADPAMLTAGLGIDVLRKFMNEFTTLADAARRNSDPAYTRWATKAAEFATQLAQFETPKLNAVAVARAPTSDTTVFRVNIFEKPRTPLPPPPESQPDGKVIDAEPVTAPVEDKPKEQQATPSSPTTEAAPAAPPSEDKPANVYGVSGSGKPHFGPFGVYGQWGVPRPYGSRHRRWSFQTRQTRRDRRATCRTAAASASTRSY
jgi:hypothetical protein